MDEGREDDASSAGWSSADDNNQHSKHITKSPNQKFQPRRGGAGGGGERGGGFSRAQNKPNAWTSRRVNNAAPAPLFVKGDVIEAAVPAAKKNLMRDYSSSSSSGGWSEDEDQPSRKNQPSLTPSQLLAPLSASATPSKPKPQTTSGAPPQGLRVPPQAMKPSPQSAPWPPPQGMRPTNQMPEPSNASRSLWSQSTERNRSSNPSLLTQQPTPASSSKSSQNPEPRKGQANPLSANVMESKYGVGFNLMSKMGLSKDQISSSATPIVPEKRAKDEGISSAPKIPEAPEKSSERQRVRKRKTVSSSEDSSSDSAVSSDVEEILPRAYGVGRGEGLTSPMKMQRRNQSFHPYSKAPVEKTFQESLREMRTNTEPGAVIDYRGPVTSVHSSIKTVTQISLPKPTSPPSRDTEESRRQKIMCFTDRLKEVEIELHRRCEESQKLTLELMRRANNYNDHQRESNLHGDDDVGDEDHLHLGGTAHPQEMKPPPPPSSSLPSSTDIVDLTNLQIGSEGLQIEWLLEQIYQLEEDFPAEMIQLKFRLRVDSLAEIALNADLQVLANLENSQDGSAHQIGRCELQKEELLDKWTLIHPALLELRNYIVGQDENDQALQIFDNLIRKTVLARFLRPFFQHCWDPVSDADIGSELMEISIKKLVSKNEFEDILRALILPKLSITMELESSRFESYPPHLWLGQWLPNLTGELQEAILMKLMNTALDNFVKTPILGRTKFKGQVSRAGSGGVASAPAITAHPAEGGGNNIDQSLLIGQWLLTWKSIFNRDQWNTLIFQGVFGLLKRWLTAPELSPALSSQVPDTLSVFLNIWKQDLPTSLISSTVVETYGARVLGWLREIQQETKDGQRGGGGGVESVEKEEERGEEQYPPPPPPRPQLNAMAALEGYGSWKILRKEQLPELKSFLKEVLDLLEKLIQR